MADYISREAAIETLHYYSDESCASFVSDFEAIPAADVVALIVVILVAIRVYAWPLWIKFVDSLPIPGQLKMWLWGW